VAEEKRTGSAAAELIERARAEERAGEWDRALELYERAFACLSRTDAGGTAEVLRWIGHVHRHRGDFEVCGDLYEASLAVAEANGLVHHVASALNCVAILEQAVGRLETAESTYRRAAELAHDSGDTRLAAMIEQNLGSLCDIRGDPSAALERYRSALARFREVGDDLAAAWALNNMGMAHADRAEWPQAQRCYDEAFELADRLRDQGTIGNVELNRAMLFLKRGAFDRARESCDRAFEIFSRAGSKSGVAESFKFYGALYRETGKPGLAAEHLERAVELAGACADPLLEAEAQSELALVHGAESRSGEALRCLNRAHRLFTALDARRELLDLDRRLDELERRYMSVVRAWGESIEAKDRYTAGHCERVARYTCMLAEALGFSGRELNWMRMGAFLHDVGKTVVPEDVLNKPGKLTSEEWELMKSHTTAGHEIVMGLDFPWEIGPIVRNHHERWDGSGYPDGLAGEAIPLTARILCIADVYDALTTTRSYRPALSQDDALQLMESEAGRGLDPDLFRIFRQLVEAEEAAPEDRAPQLVEGDEAADDRRAPQPVAARTQARRTA
jgi:putative nucleotidyltransferase with HDIG domain